LNPGNGLGSGPRFARPLEDLMSEFNWENYKRWLLSNKQKSYALKLFLYSKNHWNLLFSQELVLMGPSRERLEIIKAGANLTRYLDINYESNLHEEFTKWMKRKEIRWTIRRTIDNYQLGKKLDVKEIVKKLLALPERYRNYGLFVLVTGLRTAEGLKAFNNHSELCNDGVMELFWDRHTKKANAVFCHPILHDKINHTISHKVYKYINKTKLGFDLRDLRRVNFTISAMKVDPLLTEFMQGRRGNVSQRHYFLPMMNEHRKKWINTWDNILKRF